MTMSRIADAFQIRNRFMRSVHLERDFEDPDALRGYVVTPTAQSGFERLVGGLAPRSTQRAWRITGDYGSGKSSFALALARVLSGNVERLPSDLRRACGSRRRTVEQFPLLPVLVTASRSSLAESLLRSLASALEGSCGRRNGSKLTERIRSAANGGLNGADETRAIELIADAVRRVRDGGKASGILIVLDELGKFLEYAALHPDRQDIYFLQRLAEIASRSADTPILVVGLLHQGFNAYTEQLSLAVQKEWEKVGGRFEEFLFQHPLEQTTALIADALNVRRDMLPRGTAKLLERDMVRAVGVGWYGAGASRAGMLELAARLYPLHPTVVPVLVRLFSRFGQNERSLFSFLLSDEPFALQRFADQPPAADNLYRIHNLYDYARTVFGHRLAVQSYRSHWNQIESVVESFPPTQVFERQILKTVALLNLIDEPGLLPSEDAIALANLGAQPEGTRRTKTALRPLQRGRAVLYFRGAAGGYCLWPHTSVNLERAYEEATRAIPAPQRIAILIKDYLETRPLVARRHYIESGNLRHFMVVYAPPGELPALLGREIDGAGGRVYVALCETEEERAEAIQFARSLPLLAHHDVLVAVPPPLKGLARLLAEAQRWEWVTRNVPELNHDSFAMEEVSRQRAAAKQMLEKRVRTYIGLRQFGETTDLQWFYRGKPAGIRGGRDLLERLSTICDRVYAQAPHVRNELVNRQSLSSAAAAARLRLIEHTITTPGKPFLGMDPARKPPEMSMYLSVLKTARLHREEEGMWRIAEPPNGDDPSNVRPVLRHILEFLEGRRGQRVGVTELFAELRRPPFGIRDGFSPLLLAAFAAIHERDLAFYEGGRFVREVTVNEFQRLIKAPETFALQYCKIGGVRAVVFEKLFRALNPGKEQPGGVDILDVVKPLFVFIAQLPHYSHRTTSISGDTTAVRAALLNAQEPATLLFRQLPEAVGIAPFEGEDAPSPNRVKRFVESLRASLDELGDAYPGLIRRVVTDIHAAFDRPGGPDQAREALAIAADRVFVSVSEPRLKAFCLRLADRGLPEREWIESIGSLICSKPPAKWFDADTAAFREELGRLARQFRRVESTIFASASEGAREAMRVAITCQDGTEVEQVVCLHVSEEERAAKLEAAIGRLLANAGRVGVVAATRAIRARLNMTLQTSGTPTSKP